MCAFGIDFLIISVEHAAMQRQQIHEWKVDTDEGQRIYKAVYHSKEWSMRTAMKGSRREPAVWEDIEEIKDEHWEALREVLFNKYQRKRCPWKLVESIDKKLGKDPI